MNLSRTGSRFLAEMSNILIILFILLPIAGLLLAALQTERDLFATVPNLLPHHVTLDNFALLLRSNGVSGFSSTRNFQNALIHSVIIAAGTTTITVTAGALSAYAIALLMPRTGSYLMYGLLVTRMVPLIVLIIPLFVMLSNLQLLNSFQGIILAQSGFTLPYAIWILVSYFAALPRELEEAARTDGCSRISAFWYVMLPLCRPGIAACAIIVFLLTWNDLMLPLILGSGDDVMTLPVFISTFITDHYLAYTLVYAAGLLTMIPTVLLAVMLQRFIVGGLTAGAIKG